MSELEQTLHTMKNSAPGSDLVTYPLIEALPEGLKTKLLSTFNQFLFTGQTPDSWNIFEVLPIPKPIKQPGQLTSYRPIALGSCLRKLFEKILKNRLEWFLKSKSFLGSAQFGFRSGKSTTDSCLVLHSAIRKSFISGSQVQVAFLDVKGAFDHVDINLLLHQIRDLGIPIINTIYSLFADRIIQNKNGQIVFTSRLGIPQGSTLAPLLFNIYVNHIGLNIPKSTKILQYADDIAINSENNSDEATRHELKLKSLWRQCQKTYGIWVWKFLLKNPI